ncbi:hypothetical protein ACFLZZ_02375 [Nanoarchaeota archaeon]
MFKRPRCKRCEEKINKKYIYCPYCGFCQKDKPSEFFDSALGNLGFPFNMLTKKLFKDFEKQLMNLEKGPEPTLDPDQENFNATNAFPGGTMGVSINIDNKDGQPVIRIGSMDKDKDKNNQMKKPIRRLINPELTPEKVEKFSNLPREEPETNVTRLNNRLVYEINLPGVKKEDILIRRLESSIEIKAISDEKSYLKLIPLALPILASHLKEGKLTLELKI